MPSRILAFPFLLLLLLFLYITWELNEHYSVYLLPIAVILAIIYIMSPQINWMWYKKRPPKLDKKVEELFSKYFKFYVNLTEEDKKKFRERVVLFTLSNDFTAQGIESVPEDIKAIIAANAVQLTFGLEKYRFDKFERIIMYHQAFPSPQFPEHFHSSETYEEDGVMLFAIEHIMANFIQPGKYFNIALYEYAMAFTFSNTEINFPVMEKSIWEKIEKISGLDYEAISSFVGLPDIDPMAASISIFFTFPEKFKEELPKIHSIFCSIFNVKPA